MRRRIRRQRGGRGRRRLMHGGRHNGNGCPAGMHMMPNGTCMEGAYHGALPGQYRRGGRIRRQRGGIGVGLPQPWNKR